ncbi:MAG: cytochrome c biogenesis protein CcsA [Prevotella sp.]|nr:cytochrome c biogenesis protein CcsA [Prevotella sp.]
MKKALGFVYILLLMVMATATIVEQSKGTAFVGTHIYGSWWFTMLWGLLTAFGIAWIIRRRMRRWSPLLLHASFVVILVGALLTHLTARRGMLHLRQGEGSAQYADTEMKMRTLPFTLRLDSFEIQYHEGTASAMDYVSRVTVKDGDREETHTISMNSVLSHGGIRLYQNSYDMDGRGSVFAVNSDPWGIPTTYIGYALLFFSLLFMLIDPKGAYRRLLRDPLLKKGTFFLALALLPLNSVYGETKDTPPTLNRELADKMGRLLVNYNDRICPLQTFAIDFTKKLCGKRNYRGLSAEQVLAGWIFYGERWSDEPMLKVKGGELLHRLGMDSPLSLNSLFDSTQGYKLGPLVNESYYGIDDALHKQARQLDDKLMLIMELRQGVLLKLFPYTDEHGTHWYAPTDSIPDTVESEHKKYITEVFGRLYQDVLDGHESRVSQYFDKVGEYQRMSGGQSVPCNTKICAERLYNYIPFATILFMVCLTMGFLTLGYFMRRMVRNTHPLPLPKGGDKGEPLKGGGKRGKLFLRLCVMVMVLCFLALTLCLALRWIIRGTVPMGNGYETMLLMSWLILLAVLVAYRRFHIVLTFGFLLAGFFLLVAHISDMDPQIAHLMPVLQSPLLSIHVSIIMMSYALLSLTFICGLTAMALRLLNKHKESRNEQLASLALLSKLFLYPAMTALGLGIFIGAIWANVSWGQYWSWDAKETWALITFMVYAVVLHERSLPVFRRPTVFHLYMVLAFLSILMTYFGVNYLLGGMHSYA